MGLDFGGMGNCYYIYRDVYAIEDSTLPHKSSMRKG